MSGDVGKLSASGASADVLGALNNLIGSASTDAALLLSQGIIPKLVELINDHTDQKVKILSNSLLSLLVATSESASDVLFDDTLLVLINLANSESETLANQAADGVASIVKENSSFQVLQIAPYILAQIAEVLESDTTPLSTKQKVIAIVPLLIVNVDATPDEEDAPAGAPAATAAAASAEGGHPPFPGPSPTRLFAQSLGLLVPTLHKLSQNSAAASIKGDVDGLIKQIGDRFHKAHSKWFRGGPGAGGPPGGGPGGPPGGGPGGPPGGGFGFGGPWGPGFYGPGGFHHGFFGRGGFGRHHHGFGHEWKRGGRGRGWGPGGFGGFGKGPGGFGGGSKKV